jgi:uncharacterized membrane-anchored protein YjiN (DUF445 family)
VADTAHSIPVAPPLAREDDRRHRLTVMRRWATGTLGAVTAAWLVILLVAPAGDWAAYVRAALEASMVGALADWFAVTALFRRPLGLPIPHTAIVVARKEQFGQTLATFFRENFLSGTAVAERMRTSGSVARASTWLADREHATTMVRNVLDRSAGALDDDHERVVDVVVLELRRATAGVPLAQMSASILHAAIESPQLDDGIEAMCTAARRVIAERGDRLEALLTAERPWWLPEALQHRLFEYLVDRTVDTLDAIARDRNHPTRQQLRDALVGLVDRLEHDPAVGDRLRDLQHVIAEDPRVDAVLKEMVAGVVGRLRVEVRNPGSHLEARLVDLITENAVRVRDDSALQARIVEGVEATVDRAMTRFGDDVDALVTGTIASWDAERTADQLELLLGPDLQYIRINGAVVGALAGLVIYTIAQLVG